MGRKRRLISKPQKFGNKYAAHPLINTDHVDTDEVSLAEAPTPLIGQVVAPIPPEPVAPPPALVEEKVEVVPVATPTAPPKKRATRKRSTASRKTGTSRKTKAKTEASA